MRNLLGLFSLVTFLGLALSASANEKIDPAVNFEGEYEVVSSNVKIETLHGDLPYGPSKINQGAFVIVKKLEDQNYALYIDSYDYPLTILKNDNLSTGRNNVVVNRYSGDASKLESRQSIRRNFSDRAYNDYERLVLLAHKDGTHTLTYNAVEVSGVVSPSGAKVDATKTAYTGQIVLRKIVR